MHAGTAEPLRVSPPEAVAYPLELLRNPRVIPHLHQTWAEAKQQNLSGLEAQHAQLVQRRQRLERQDQRLLDAYQAEIITLNPTFKGWG